MKKSFEIKKTLTPTNVETDIIWKNIELAVLEAVKPEIQETILPVQKQIFKANVIKMTLEIPKELAKKMKLHCFENEITIKDFVTGLLKRELE